MADVVLPLPVADSATVPDVSLASSLSLLKKPVPARKPPPAAHRSTEPPSLGAVWRPDDLYASEPYPSREHRLLALFRLWTVIHDFYPYLHLLGDTWDRALVEYLPKFEAATDARAYDLLVAELAARIPDGHMYVSAGGKRVLDEVSGPEGVPIVVQRIDGAPVVTVLRDPQAALSAGIAVGDEIVSVDGEPFAVRVARVQKYVAASTDWARALYADAAALRGPAGSIAVLGVRGADGKVRDLRFPRTKTSPPPDTTPTYRLLPDGFGYADLTRLSRDDVGPMFAAFASSPGIVFDMRGYPRGTAWSIAPRLARTEGAPSAEFFRNLVGGTTGDEPNPRLQFFTTLPIDKSPRYRGLTVMLIDERAISQSEHSGLMFEAANGTRFIGSPSAGANGDVTNTCLPGNVCVSFSGHEVSHADGRQLQMVGLTPDVKVRPTVAGLRAGRDEVLERAIETLRAGTTTAEPRVEKQ